MTNALDIHQPLAKVAQMRWRCLCQCVMVSIDEVLNESFRRRCGRRSKRFAETRLTSNVWHKLRTQMAVHVHRCRLSLARRCTSNTKMLLTVRRSAVTEQTLDHLSRANSSSTVGWGGKVQRLGRPQDWPRQRGRQTRFQERPSPHSNDALWLRVTRASRSAILHVSRSWAPHIIRGKVRQRDGVLSTREASKADCVRRSKDEHGRHTTCLCTLALARMHRADVWKNDQPTTGLPVRHSWTRQAETERPSPTASGLCASDLATQEKETERGKRKRKRKMKMKLKTRMKFKQI